jgi:hypothetical protein
MDCRVKPGNDSQVADRQRVITAFAGARSYCHQRASPAGLTRGSIFFVTRQPHFREAMDCRVKPGNDSQVADGQPVITAFAGARRRFMAGSLPRAPVA